ncbi:MAG: adenylosuccinate lyase [Chloroflexota bacterium]|nr:adenylosuccinate lyase [Chloroflexota bacterium]
MIERYAVPEIQAIWSEARKLDLWLRIELLAVEAWAAAGRIPREDAERLGSAVTSVDTQRMREIEREAQHDVIAFLRSVTETLGTEGRWLHFGLTSSDVLDTATAVQLTEATDIVRRDVDRLIASATRLATDHRDTLMVGRTHGIHAEPITFGFKAAGWVSELRRDAERLRRARDGVAVGKLSGAVGTHANVPVEVERDVCARLGLTPDPASTQVVSRDRHAELVGTLAILGGTLERIATEVRHLQRTEVGEAFEPFGAGQQGSSAMPHKRNPVLAERVSGLARLLRADALVALENMALWHERDISHSSAERFVFERALGVAAYATRTLAVILEGLVVVPERMRANLDAQGGMVYSEAVLLALIESGLDRHSAYRLVQRAAMAARPGGPTFRDALLADPVIHRRLSAAQLDRLFDPAHAVEHVAETFAALGLDRQRR